MSGSVNRVVLIGHVGGEPEVRQVGQGEHRVANISLATNRRWTDEAGNRQERTEWHRIVAWDRQAELVEQYVGKGDRLYVEGRLEHRKWEDQEGNNRKTTEVVVRRLVFLNGGRGGRNRQPAAAGQKASRPDSGPMGDLPF